jgi:DNA mismatch repair protein MutL
MKKIRLLPDEVAQKIAAGEVIERPVSVVKELVENSLDAAADDIRVDLIEGGKRLIKVRDNGSGMSREDASLCFRRHSTSKISNEEDLERIETLGFRGEALASIAAVSRLTLRSFDGDEERGTMIEREGERLVAVTDIAFPRGTEVEVANLFFNLPARRKFMRSNQSELGQISKYLTQAALAYPRIRFGLYHGTREVINCPRVETLRDRIFQLYGGAVVEGLMEIQAQEEESRLDGFASLPLRGRRDKSRQFFFVNSRPVKDRILQAALNQAYSGILERDRAPEGFVFLSLPFGEVDVNVHPTKAEVRFGDSQLAFRLVLKAVEHALAKGQSVKEVYPEEREGSSVEGVGEAGQGAYAGLNFEAVPLKTPDVSVRIEELSVKTGRETAAGEEGGPEVLGQFENMYIVVGTAEGLLVIDQHNAHERVLYEKYRAVDREKLWPRKMLLIPEVFDLSPSEAVSFEESGPLIEELGFRAESMGGRSFALKEYPDIFRPEDAKEIFMALIEEAGKGKVKDLRDKLLATLACKTAVKAGQPLGREKMGYLVEELFKTNQPALCPHGRPVIVKIEKAKIDKGMGR